MKVIKVERKSDQNSGKVGGKKNCTVFQRSHKTDADVIYKF